MITKLTLKDAIKAAEIYDGTVYDLDRFEGEWKWAIKNAFNYPDKSREVRSSILQATGRDPDWDAKTEEIYERYTSWLGICGRDSMLFNTLIRSVSVAQLSKKQVDNIQRKKDKDPPAFDTSFRAEQTEYRRKLRLELSEWLRKSNDPWLASVRAKFSKEIERLKNLKEDQLIKLTNGTTTMIQWDTFNVNDIVSIVFCPEDFKDKFERLGKFFRVGNRYSEDDPFLYVEIPQCEMYSSYGGEHLNIPDKDGKIREIYRMFAWIQVLSKAVHKSMDNIVKDLEGNYTYNHREWLRNIVNKGWNKSKYIIGTDMSKYSDTLDRSFIMELLEVFGFPTGIVTDLDLLYSQDIWDSLRQKGLHNTLATQQGQYGDFPFITLANLVLQRFVYYKLNLPCLEGYTAAVGDDTGMVFDKKPENIITVIQDVYGCVGVRINKTKTSELDHGVGRVDFVKRELTVDGIIDFLNTRAIWNNNIDSVIRDVFDLESCTDSTKISILKAMFGIEGGENLAALSIINGGIKDTPISEGDLLIYLERNRQITKLLGYNPDETNLLLIRLQSYLKTYDPIDEHYLCETPLISFLDEEEIERASDNLDQLDEMIKLEILNMTRLGLRRGNKKHVQALLNKVPSELRSEFEKKDWDPTKDKEAAELWADVTNYETYAAYRRRSEAANRRKVSVMLPVINGFFNDIGHYPIPEYLYYPELLIKSVEEYTQAIIPYKAARTIEILKGKLQNIKFETKSVCGNTYDYVKILEDNGRWKTYRLYDVLYHSRYDMIPRDKFDKYIAPQLKGYNISYEDFTMLWSNQMRISYKDIPSLRSYLT